MTRKEETVAETAPLRILIVGAGAISREFALHHFDPSHTGAIVVGIADLDKEKASNLATEVGSVQAGAKVLGDGRNWHTAATNERVGEPVPHFGSVEKALDDLGNDVDAVYIGTPPGSHRVLVEQSLKRFKHVLLEKPIAATREDTDLIIAAHDNASPNCALAMNIGMRYNPALHELRRRILTDGELGAKVRATLNMHFKQWPRLWQRQPWCAGREEGGPLREVGTHYFSALLEFSGAHDDEGATAMTPVEAKVRAVVNYPDDMPDGSRSPLCEREASGVIELKGGALSSDGIVVDFSVRTNAPEDIYELTFVPSPNQEDVLEQKKSLTLFDFCSLRNGGGDILIKSTAYGRKDCVRALVAAAKGQKEKESAPDGPSIVTARHGSNAQRILDAVLMSNGKWCNVQLD